MWGAVVAAGAAYILNTIFGIGMFILTNSDQVTDLATGSFSAPLTEESFKAMAIFLVFLIFRKEFDSVMDGIVYGGIVALGFAATENALYLYERGYAVDGWQGFWFLFLLRVIFGAWNHPFYTAFTGISLAITRLNKNVGVRLIAPGIGLGLAMFTHFVHNTLATFVEGLGGLTLVFMVDWLGWLFMIGVILWAIGREKQWLQTQLKEEVGNGVLSDAQYKVAVSALRRSYALFNALLDGKFGDTRRFYMQCTELAYKKYQFGQVGETRGNPATLIEQLRENVKRLAPRAAV
jgi:RsiW-degrading membrane proteinase PrsW (M82 family)